MHFTSVGPLPLPPQIPDAMLMGTHDIFGGSDFGRTQSSFGMGDSVSLPPTRSTMGAISCLPFSIGAISPCHFGLISGLFCRHCWRQAADELSGDERGDVRAGAAIEQRVRREDFHDRLKV